VLTISNSNPVATTGGNVRLETDDHFVNNDGVNAFNVTGGGTWRVYSQDPTLDIKGGLTSAQYNFVQYNAPNSYATPFANADAALNVAASGNGFLYAVNPTVSTSLTGAITKVYDGTTAGPPLTGSNYTPVTGTINGDVVTLLLPTGPSVGTYSDKNVGVNKTVTVSGGISAWNGSGLQRGYDSTAMA